MKLKNKVALVTGAGRGIGKAIAIELHKQGAKVYVHYNASELDAKSLANQIQGIAVQANLTTPEGCQQLADSIPESIDILVNNAGLTNDKLVIQMTDNDWYKPMKINLDAVFRLSKIFGLQMMRNRTGAIINITSITGIRPNRGQAN